MKFGIELGGCYVIRWKGLDDSVNESRAYLKANSIIEVTLVKELSPEVMEADKLIAQWQRGELGRGEFVDALQATLCPESEWKRVTP